MPETSPGLMASIRQLVSTLASIVSTRLELLANELQVERLRLLRMLILVLSALFSFGMAALLLVAYVVVLFWDDHRLAAIGVLGAMFFALGALLAWLLRNQARTRLFSDSLAELAKDRQHLDADHD